MRRLLTTLLIIPLVIVIASKSPQATGHLVALIITAGADILNGVASFLVGLLRAGH